MANNNTENLDLAQILATLASLPQTQSSSTGVPQAHQPYDPHQGFYQATQLSEQHDISYQHDQRRDPRQTGRFSPTNLPHGLPQHRTSTPPINPATITEWKHGLRCVNKIATQTPAFDRAVRKLMQDQQRNLHDWEAGRRRLIDEQTAKRENEKTHRAALSLPGILGDSAPLRTPQREKEELDLYDRKVYRACRLMVDSQTASLKGLGVPFFGVKSELVVVEGSEEGADGKITKKEVLELQRKMLNHLMEMYGD